MTTLRIVSLALVLGTTAAGFAGAASPPSRQPVSQNAGVRASEINPEWMLEGEKRYRTNCGRCHQPPPKFAPQAMAMVVRQMRVRAMLTQEDMKYVLYYVTH